MLVPMYHVLGYETCAGHRSAALFSDHCSQFSVSCMDICLPGWSRSVALVCCSGLESVIKGSLARRKGQADRLDFCSVIKRVDWQAIDGLIVYGSKRERLISIAQVVELFLNEHTNVLVTDALELHVEYFE